MLFYIIRYFFIILCIIYSYNRVLNLKINNQMQYLTCAIFSLLLSIITSIFIPNETAIRILFLLIIMFIFFMFYFQTKTITVFISTIISFTISYIALLFSSFLFGIILTPIYMRHYNFDVNPYIIYTGLLQFLIIFLLFKIKRFKNGMPFLLKKCTKSSGIVMCTTIISLILFLHIINPTALSIHFIAMLFILFLAFLLLFWWRRRITLDYVQKLRMDEVESLYKKISDNEREIEKLNTNNDYLSKVIHKDNKLIPAMEMALHSYLLEAPSMEAEEARQFGADLLSQLQSMSAERESIISNYQKNTDFHPKIGIYSVDAVILYMEKRAEKFNITYNLRFDNDIKDAIVGFIHERDMLHLLSDLIENAIIAVKDASHREIFLHIGFLQGGLFIDLYDSGIPFEPAVYQDFGNCQHTTHADSGGSGIGLMDIWNLKRKYKASLQIYEYLPDSDIYTKKIRLLFDRRNHFLLQTYRDKEIRSFITRSDLHVFPLKEMKKKDKE